MGCPAYTEVGSGVAGEMMALPNFCLVCFAGPRASFDCWLVPRPFGLLLPTHSPTQQPNKQRTLRRQAAEANLTFDSIRVSVVIVGEATAAGRLYQLADTRSNGCCRRCRRRTRSRMLPSETLTLLLLLLLFASHTLPSYSIGKMYVGAYISAIFFALTLLLTTVRRVIVRSRRHSLNSYGRRLDRHRQSWLDSRRPIEMKPDRANSYEIINHPSNHARIQLGN